MLLGLSILSVILFATTLIISVEKSFLEQAAERQQMKIALGQLAEKKAASEAVQQFGVEMIEDYQEERKELQQLASQAGIRLQTVASDKQRQTEGRLLQLYGRSFDRAYMRYMVSDLEEDVKIFERYLQKLEDEDVKRWAADALPMLRDHLQKARTIASTLGLKVSSLPWPFVPKRDHVRDGFALSCRGGSTLSLLFCSFTFDVALAVTSPRQARVLPRLKGRACM